MSSMKNVIELFCIYYSVSINITIEYYYKQKGLVILNFLCISTSIVCSLTVSAEIVQSKEKVRERDGQIMKQQYVKYFLTYCSNGSNTVFVWN